MLNRQFAGNSKIHNMTSQSPTMFNHTLIKRSNRESGFSLLEVLIALLVLSVGLLGIAGLQTVSLRFNHQSYERTQATVLISEIFEKITANPVAASGGSFDAVAETDTSSSFTGYGACPASCSPVQLATLDLFRWKSSIEDPRRLAQGQGSIRRIPDPDGATAHVYEVTISWVENNLSMTQRMRMRTQRTQL
jgi:type IV pilus assembly protein PilV